MKFVNQKSLFKVIGVSALATCMLATSLFAFIPNSTQAETLNSNQTPSSTQTTTPTTEQTGLITPRADDPVIFTTESGLEIKYGNAIIQGSLESGNLAGFPYFTTTTSSTTYHWVIIGHNGLILDETPASISMISEIEKQEIFPIKKNSELDEGNVLCLSNSVVGKSSRGGSSNYESDSSLHPLMLSYYEDDIFGFGILKNKIMNTTLQTRGYHMVTITERFFLLDQNDLVTSFKLFNYLTPMQASGVGNCWARSYTGSGAWYYFDDTSKTFKTTKDYSQQLGIRPAFVMSFSVFSN